MERVSEELSCKFKNMAIVCAILVVFIHAKFAPPEVGSALWFYQVLIPKGISAIGVPFFFLASGYFLAGHIGEDGWWKREVCKRVRTLLVPFVLWNVIHVIIGSGLGIVADVLAHRAFGTSITVVQKPGLWFMGLNPFYETPHVVTWYIRSLFALVILTPVIVWALKRFARVFILGAWVLSLVAVANNWYGVPYLPRFAVEGGLAYFSLGIFLRRNPIHVEGRWLWLGSAVVALALLAVHVGASYTGKYPAIPLVKLAIPFAMYAVWGLIPAKRWAKSLTSLAFACYVLHVFVLLVLHLVISTLVESLGLFPNAPKSLEAWLLITLGVPLTLLLGHAMYRFCPRASAVLFGGR